MPFPSHVFREYDIRGVADTDLTSDLVREVAATFAGMLAEQHPAGKKLRIPVGRDCRLSSPRLHAALVEGLLGAGVDVVDIGVGPTPQLYFAVHHLDGDGGV